MPKRKIVRKHFDPKTDDPYYEILVQENTRVFSGIPASELNQLVKDLSRANYDTILEEEDEESQKEDWNSDKEATWKVVATREDPYGYQKVGDKPVFFEEDV